MHNRPGHLTFIVVTHGAVAGRVSDIDFGYIAYTERRTCLCRFDENTADVLFTLDKALAAYKEHAIFFI